MPTLDLLEEPLPQIHLSKEDVHVIQIGLIVLDPQSLGCRVLLEVKHPLVLFQPLDIGVLKQLLLAYLHCQVILQLVAYVASHRVTLREDHLENSSKDLHPGYHP